MPPVNHYNQTHVNFSPVACARYNPTESGTNAKIKFPMKPYPVIADALRTMPYSRVREVAEIAFKMDGVLKLYFGESNQPTPEFIRNAVIQALTDGHTFYTPNAGTLALRSAIAAYYRRIHSVEIDPVSEVVVTASGVQALNVAIRTVLNPGDEVIALTPAWPNAGTISALSGAVVKEVAQPLVGNRYQIDFEALEAAVSPRTKLLVYTSPSNPLGWVATERDQDMLLDFARRHGIWLLADEVYDRLYYEGNGTAPSMLKKANRDDALLVVQSFSESYCMTGWRLGFVIARSDAGQKIGQLNEYTISNAAAFTQRAGEVALAEGEEHIRLQLSRLRANRDYCLQAMREMPRLTVPDPTGAFYLFPKVEGLSDSLEFCKRLLREKLLGIAPGMAFGKGGEGSVRLCYAAEMDVLEPAMVRLSAFLQA